jgi:hypothetical protein
VGKYTLFLSLNSLTGAEMLGLDVNKWRVNDMIVVVSHFSTAMITVHYIEYDSPYSGQPEV